MKNKPLLFKILCFLLFMGMSGCTNDEPEPKLINSIEGVWELEKEFNPWRGPVSYLAGNGNRYHFTKTTYQRYVNGKLVSEGVYVVKKEYSSLLKSNYTRLVLLDEIADQMDHPPLSITFEEGHLNINVLAMDAPSFQYLRLE